MKRRWPQSEERGRKTLPAECYLRLMGLKHFKKWSYRELVEEVKWNIAYRRFCRLGGRKMPHYSAVARIGKLIEGEVVGELNELLVKWAAGGAAIAGKKLRVDTTVVETNIHYPTDSSLLGDGIRVLTRSMKRVQDLTGQVGTRLVNRMRSTKKRLVEITRISKSRAKGRAQRLKQAYVKLLKTAQQVAGRAQRFVQEIEQGIKPAPATLAGAAQLEGLSKYLQDKAQLLRKVISQTRARILEGNTHYKGKIFSLFEPHTEAIRKGKAGKETEFGKLVKIQECEAGLITDYEVYAHRPADVKLWGSSLVRHEEIFGRMPQLAAADHGFYSGPNERQAQQAGVKKVCLPRPGKNTKERIEHQRQAWFRRARKWRNGSEGRISVLKRSFGMDRCLYSGLEGMERWVGWSVMANNLRSLAKVT
ncbi:ISNCY family transposase [Acidobacteria bacterium AH-259-L09]|nr:ISNCY family transposase [Acidobacteria bacterium AH-259-L09]